jgi:two-component system, OmpR family, KDP operon response regulator KdpE
MSIAKVLLVDDNPLVRSALRTTLTSAGYAVVEAMTGGEAMEKLETPGAVDMVLLDLKMPDIGGLETCQMIREIDDVPILIISVLRDPQDKRQASEAGADGYIEKPFGIQQLLSRMRSLCGGAAAEVRV